MTSFVIKAHEDRVVPAAWSSPDCPFCRIIRGESPAYKVYEDDIIVVILDIMPLRPGHALVIPKTHVSRVSELPDNYAAQCGLVVSKVARAISSAVCNTALNVVCNQEFAQAVPHVHYHIIPAPRVGAGATDVAAAAGPSSSEREARDHVTQPLTEKEMHWREYESRGRLNELDARSLVESIRARL